MARKPRIHFPGAIYHVISRGNRRQDIFLSEGDLKTFLSYLSEYKTRYSFHLYAYAFMGNHIHLLLEVEEDSLSKIMQTLLFRYTRYFNRRYGKTGHLFEGRYRAILCDKDAYLLELVRYIHLNPVRAKVVKDPERYKWTSHQRYLGKGVEGLIEEEFLLKQFGKDKSIARRKYRKFVMEGLGWGHEEKYYEVKDQRYLGEESFIDRIESKKREVEAPLYDIPIGVIVREVSRRTGISREKMHGLTRQREGARGRGIVAYLARMLSGQKVKDIAVHFGRSPMVMSQAVIKVEKELVEDKDLHQMIDLLKEDLIKNAKKKYFVTIA
jgi:putative transposase